MMLILFALAIVSTIQAVDICVEHVLSSSIPQVNFQPIPGHDDLFLIGDLSGVIKIYSADSVDPGSAFSSVSVLLDLRDKINFGGEAGLLGVAVHKDFASNGRFYVSFICAGPSAFPDCAEGDSVIDEYTVIDPSTPTGLQANITTIRRIFKTFQPYENHNGGLVLFSPDPADPNLYMVLGDGGSAGDPDDRAVSGCFDLDDN